MSEQYLITNLRMGIEAGENRHIRNFPDQARKELKGVYSRIHGFYPRCDPMFQAAAILSIISVTGGLITVNQEGYRCNNGFIDSHCTFYRSERPVLENIQVMTEYIADEYFVDKAVGYLYHREPEKEMLNAKQYKDLIQWSLDAKPNEEDRERLFDLKDMIDILSVDRSEW